jgi:hypothetical protein
MPIQSNDGEIWDDEKAQAAIRETIQRCGRFVLGASLQPRIGEIQEFAGLPLKVTRYVSKEEANRDEDLTADIWQYRRSNYAFYFEVEVAD